MKKAKLIVICVVAVFAFMYICISNVDATILTSNIHVSRAIDTSVKITIDAQLSSKADVSCTVLLQEKQDDSWETATGVPVEHYSETFSNTENLSFSKKIEILKDKTYRVKVLFKEKSKSTVRYSADFDADDK